MYMKIYSYSYSLSFFSVVKLIIKWSEFVLCNEYILR